MKCHVRVADTSAGGVVFVVVVATILLGMSVAVPLGMASVGKRAIKCYISYRN